MVIIFLAGFVSSGCTYRYSADLSKQTLQNLALRSEVLVERHSSWVLHPSTPIAVAQLGTVVENTGWPRHDGALFDAVSATLSRQFPSVYPLRGVSTFSRALAEARKLEAQVLLIPKILRVEDDLNTRAELTEGAGIHKDRRAGRDRVLMQMAVFDVVSGRQIDVTVATARGRMFAPKESLPVDMMASASEHWVAQLSALTQPR